MAQHCKFTSIGRKHLTDSLLRPLGDDCSPKYSLTYLRPELRATLLKIAAGERVHPELTRVVLAGCVKVAALRAVVYTRPTKTKGLRIQSSDIILGEPGLGKGSPFQ